VRDATLQLDQLNGAARNPKGLAREYGQAFGRQADVHAVGADAG